MEVSYYTALYRQDHSLSPAKDGSWNSGKFAHIERMGTYPYRGIFCDHLGPLIQEMLSDIGFNNF